MGEVIQARMQGPDPEPGPDEPVPGFDDGLGNDSPPGTAAAAGGHCRTGRRVWSCLPPNFNLDAEPLAPGPGPAADVPFGAGDLFAPPPDQPLPPINVPAAPAPGFNAPPVVDGWQSASAARGRR